MAQEMIAVSVHPQDDMPTEVLEDGELVLAVYLYDTGNPREELATYIATPSWLSDSGVNTVLESVSAALTECDYPVSDGGTRHRLLKAVKVQIEEDGE